MRLREIPQYDDFARLERDLRALAAASGPGESSRRGPGRADGGAALEDGLNDDAAFRELREAVNRRTPSLRVALVGRAAADDDDLVTCAHAVMENGGGHDRENDVARSGSSPTAASTPRDARLEASLKKKKHLAPVRAIFVDATTEHHLARQTARHGEWLRDAQVVSAARVEAPRWRLEDARGNRVVMHDARSFGETSDAARKNDWSLVVAHDRFDAAGGGAMHASGDGGGSGGGSVSGRILANLLDANLGLHVLGTRTRERILAPGTRLTAVGEAVLERVDSPRRESTSGSKSDDDDVFDAFDSASYRVRFRKPSRDFTHRSSHSTRRNAIDAFTVTNKSFDAFANGFGRAGNALRVLSAACFVLGFGLSLSRVVRARVVAGREKKFRQRLAAAQAARAENGEPDASVAAPGETCVVCLYSRATACYKECGHLVCCEVCAARMQRCPLCRKKSAWMKVYRAGG